jgi:hypothetical protein
MSIEKLEEFAKDGDKNLDNLNVSQGFLQSEKPERQWFNQLLNNLTRKTNEVIDDVSAQKLDTGIIVTSKNGTLSIDQSVKNAQTISMVEYGAVGDGTTDDTSAFELLEANVTGREIDLQGKVYKVKDTPLANKYKDGFFSIAGIIHPSEFKEQELKFKKHCMQFVTGNRYSGVPRIFGGSDNVFQAICIVPQPTGYPKLYVTNRSDRDDGQQNGNWLIRETYRIVEYDFKEDGSDVVVSAFSQPLNIGHASGLGYDHDESGQLYFYSGFPNDSETDTNRSDKGYSKIKWRGSATSNSDIEYRQLWAYTDSSTNSFAKYSKISLSISADKRYLCTHADNSSTGRIDVLIYDFKEVEALSNPLTAKPLHIFELADDTRLIHQGILVHNEKVILYYDRPQNSSKIRIYNFTGSLLAEYDFDTYQYYYSSSELRGAKGVLPTRESEGITIFGNDIYVGYRNHWASIEKTVTYDGKYYAAMVSNKGQVPTDTLYWQEIDSQYALGATAWDALTTYSVTEGSRTEVNKRIYKITSIDEIDNDYLENTNMLRRASYRNLGVVAGGSVTYSDVVPPVVSYTGLKGDTLVAEYSGKNAVRTVSQHGEQYMKALGTATPLTLDTSSSVEAFSLMRNNEGTFGIHANGSNTMVTAKNGSNLGLNTFSDNNSTGLVGPHIQLVISGANTTSGKFFASRTSSDVDLGEASKPFKNLYVAVAPVVTSDAREKQQVRDLSAAEIAAAKELRQSIKLYRLNREVDDEHSRGVWHTGVIAQEVVEIMKSHGLDALDYGLVNHVVWDDEAAIIEDGQEIQAARSAGDKYAVRYDELAMFVLAAI